MAKIIVEGTEITVIKSNDEDFISLTDMIRAKDGDFFVTDWLRNRNTLEYIGIWEKFYNPAFNYGEFAIIKSQARLNSFKISVKEFVSKTNAICLQAKAGRRAVNDAEAAYADDGAYGVSVFKNRSGRKLIAFRFLIGFISAVGTVFSVVLMLLHTIETSLQCYYLRGMIIHSIVPHPASRNPRRRER